MKKLKIAESYIGCRIKAGNMNRWYDIKEGNEQLYWDAGLIFIFERDNPSIVKIKGNAKNRKKSTEPTDSNGIRVDNNNESPLSV